MSWSCDLGVVRSILDLLLAQGCPPYRRARLDERQSDPGDSSPTGCSSRTAPETRPPSPTPSRLRGACSAACRCSASVSGHQLLALALGLRTYKLPLRAQGRQPPRQGPAHGEGRGNDAEPRLRRDATRPASLRHRAHACEPQRRHRRGAGRCGPPCLLGAVPGRHPGPHDAQHLFARFAAEMQAFRGAAEADDGARPRQPARRRRARRRPPLGRLLTQVTCRHPLRN